MTLETIEATQALVADYGALDFELEGSDGNAFAIIGSLLRAARTAGWPAEAREKLQQLLTRGDYDDLLAVAIYATEEPEEDE